MANLKLHIELNKGKRGIALDKLEKVVQEMRRFLESMGDDIELVEPDAWVSADFTNGSVGFVTEYSHAVAPQKLGRFNDAIIALARSEFPPSLERSTSNKFFQLAAILEQGETVNLEVFGENKLPIPLPITQQTATLARMIKVLPFRETVGSVQGKIHALYKESKPHPHFTLRELSTGNLIRCQYQLVSYPAIIRALGEPEQVIHVNGNIMTDTRGQCIHHVDVIDIWLAEPYGYEDVQKFLGALGEQ